jgi:hypothetical protein
MKKSLSFCIGIILCIAISNFTACSKRTFISSKAKFSFSTDTLTFDTVFTTQGSVTKSFLITNNNDKWLRLNRIKLGGGNASAFRLNVDGTPTKDITNIDIAPFDSVYVFAAITIDPTAADNPFIIEDSIEVFTNDARKSLPLIAYGQNAIYVNDSVLQGNITWTKNKPIVIVNSALIDSDAVLTIQPGTRVYMHDNSKLFVKGSLIANGTKQDSIVFCGDRLDRNYFGGDIPGEWCGLHFLQKSKNNSLQYCTIKNGGSPWKVFDAASGEYFYLTGALIYLEPNEAGVTAPKLNMRNCFVGLSIAYGILAFNGNMTATNCLIYSCGSQNFAALEGGNYSFTNCTFGNYGYKVFLRHDKNSILALKNYFLPNPDDITTLRGNSLTAIFNDCIVDGTATEGDEVFIDNINTWTSAINFNYCLLKQKTSLNGLATIDAKTTSLLNKSPAFKKPNELDFELDAGSFAKGNGNPSSTITIDIKDNTRANPVSIGCWE